MSSVLVDHTMRADMETGDPGDESIFFLTISIGSVTFDPKWIVVSDFLTVSPKPWYIKNYILNS
jgi:hypothetical protein